MKTIDAGVLAAVAIGAVALAFWPVPDQLLALWLDSDRPYSHGLLVGPLAVWLVVRACRRARGEPSSRSWAAAMLFVVATLAWVAAYAADVMIAQQLLFPALLVLAVAAAAGWSMARRLAFPVGFLYFAIPVWAAATGALQAITVAVVGSVLDVAAIPVFVEGNFITIPEGVFEVAGGCAGLHFFIVALTIATLNAYLSLRGFWSRMVLVGAAIGIALITNWVRVGSLVAIGHYTNMQHYLISHDHYYYGWVLFAIALIPLWVLSRRLSGDDGEADAVRVRPPRAAGRRWSTQDSGVVAFLGIVVVIPLAVVRGDGGAAPAASLDVRLPEGRGGWQRTAPDPLAWQPQFAGADGEALSSYLLDGDGTRVDVFLAVYRSQTQGRELIGDGNRLFAPDHVGVSVASASVSEVPSLGTVREQIASSPDGRRRVVWYWYAVGSRLVADDLYAKLWQVVHGVGGSDSGAVAAVSIECGHDCSRAGAELQAFLQAMGEPLVTASVKQQSGGAL